MLSNVSRMTNSNLNSGGPGSKRIPEYVTNMFFFCDSKFVTQGGRDSLRKVQ